MDYLSEFRLTIETLGVFIKNSFFPLLLFFVSVKNDWLFRIINMFNNYNGEFRVQFPGVAIEAISLDQVKDEFISIEENIKRLTKNAPKGGTLPYLTYEERTEIVDKLIVLDAFGANLTKSKNLNLLILMGNYHYHCREFYMAEKYYQNATFLENTTVSCYCNLGWARLKQRNYHKSLQAFQSARNIDPRSSHAVLGIAASLNGRGELNEAINKVNEAIILFESNLKKRTNKYFLHCGLGIAKILLYEFTKKKDENVLLEAIAHYDDAIGIDDNVGLAYYQKSCAFMRFNEVDDNKKNESVAALLKAILLNPTLREFAIDDEILKGVAPKRCFKCVIEKNPPKIIP